MGKLNTIFNKYIKKDKNKYIPNIDLKTDLYLKTLKNMNREEFKVGDIVYQIKSSTDNLPQYAINFLINNNQFTIRKFNSSGKLDLGCYREKDNGGHIVFYFNPNRFTKDINNTNPLSFDSDDDYNFDIDWD